jgi:PAS domain S-box-containing protein
MAEAPESAQAVILYADDTPAQRYALSRILRNAGFHVLEADTGRGALDMLAQSPDLIVLDVNLPDISGIEVCQRIKSAAATAYTPVVQVSATMVDTQSRVAGLEGGADAYLTQPIEPRELIATVKALLRVRQAEESARRQARELEAIYSSAPVGLAMFDKDLRFVRVNRFLAEINGLPPEEHVGHTLHELSEALDSNVGPLYRTVIATGDPILNVEVSTPRPSDPGIMRDWLLNLYPLKDETGQVLGINTVVQEITDRKRAEELAIQQETQKRLLAHTIRVQEDERRRIAQELHDEAGQLMTSLLVGLRTLNDARRLADAKLQARRLREIASGAIGELGRLARGLHSTVLDDLGLEAGIRRYVDEFSKTHSIEVRLDFHDAPLNDFNRDEQLNLYRIVQEALTNVARHSRAKKVKIEFRQVDSELRIAIRDYGRGLASQRSAAKETVHLGIEGMRQRAAMLGGTLHVSSTPRSGVTVSLHVPSARPPAERRT